MIFNQSLTKPKISLVSIHNRIFRPLLLERVPIVPQHYSLTIIKVARKLMDRSYILILTSMGTQQLIVLVTNKR
jgi:hypothetical protein